MKLYGYDCRFHNENGLFFQKEIKMRSDRSLIGKFMVDSIFTTLLISPVSGQEWQVVPSPNPNSYENVFWSVAGSSANDVWAVGSYNESNIPLIKMNFAAHWNGVEWQHFSTPSLSQTYNRLTGVAVVSENEAWACGEYNPPGPAQMTMLHWDGNQWSSTEMPFIDGGATLHAMKKIASDDIWAVGAKIYTAIAMHFDGSNWEYLEAPHVGTRFNRFWAVDGTSSDNIWAVGRWGDDWGQFYPLIMKWDGSGWQHIPGPDGYSMVINGVSVISPDDVWMVGVTMDAQPRFLHWDGQNVNVESSPGGGRSISAVGFDDIWSVEGNSAVHWDGQGWQQQSIPSYVRAYFVAVIPGGEMWAVGTRYDGGYGQSMTMFYPVETGIEDEVPKAERFGLSQNYPNPFNASTSLEFSITRSTDVRLEVFDILGRKVISLYEGILEPGTHQINWKADNFPSGTYFYRLNSDEGSQTRKMTLIK